MLLPEDGSSDLFRALNSRLSALSYHVREHYWVDMRKLNEIYRYKTEEYSHDAVNKFNIYPEQIPLWLIDWMPNQGGYMLGNLQPAHMDFRFFSLGNLWAIVGSLATEDQSEEILNFIEAKWDDLIGTMPLKIAFPALEYDEWRITTGSDPKNTYELLFISEEFPPFCRSLFYFANHHCIYNLNLSCRPWSYHNGGSWPTLLWQVSFISVMYLYTNMDISAY